MTDYPLPPELPPSTSPEWAERKEYEPLAYLRAQCLGRSDWSRDSHLIDRAITREMGTATDTDRPLLQKAQKALGLYQERPSELLWEDFVNVVDELIMRRAIQPKRDVWMP